MLTNTKLKKIFDKTKGHCHFCGDPIVFEEYGSKETKGAWEADHVIQKAKGGPKDDVNCLPSCTKCNRLRWHRKGDNLRDLIFLGLIVKDEIKKGSDIGKKIKLLKNKRIKTNVKRRRKIISNK